MEKKQHTILHISHLKKSFGHFQAVHDFSLVLNQGDIFGILGPNGAGKSTIIKMILGLIIPSEGEIKISGYSITKNFEKAIVHTGNLVETPAFYDYLSGRKNLELLQKFTSKSINSDQQINWALEKVKLLDRAGDKVKKYSQGMRQRLGIAAAIMNKPKLVILDEPTNGLDPEGMIEMRELIKQLARADNITFLISSHLLSEIEQLCNRIVILNQGKAIAEGAVADLIRAEDENLEKLFLRLTKKKQV